MTKILLFLISRLTRGLTGVAVAWLMAGPGASRVVMFSYPRKETAPASESMVFHLGTAAGPFGWSSAVADFDGNGEPDFTIADRLEGTAGGGYTYRIVFSIAGRAAQSVSFESRVVALTVAIQDIDHDDDLDVLVTEAPSRMVNAVWLNDGHGRFVESPLRPPIAAWLAEAALGYSADESSPSLIVPNRIGASHVQRSATEPLEPGRFVAASTDRVIPPSLAVATSSRAPPRTLSRSLV